MKSFLSPSINAGFVYAFKFVSRAKATSTDFPLSPAPIRVFVKSLLVPNTSLRPRMLVVYWSIVPGTDGL